jgi:hypothetical protein
VAELFKYGYDIFMAENWDWSKELYDSSKMLVLRSVEILKHEPDLFEPLLELAISEKGLESQRAARIIYYAIEMHPELFSSYTDEILDALVYITDESVKFPLLHVFTVCRLPEDEERLGLLTGICFDSLESNAKRIASKVYAIDILYRLSQLMPDMKRELIYVFEKYMEGAQMAYLNRAGKLIAKLRKEVKKNYE